MKRYLLLALIIALLLPYAFQVDKAAALEIGQLPSKQETNLLLHVGSPIALSGGKILPLDSENPDLAAFVHKNRTLVPMRMIAEHFGAVIDYDRATNSALLTIGEKKAAFPIGKNYFTLDGKRIDLDTETLLVSNRTFVPLRVICEQILGLQVDYKDSVIYIAETAKLNTVIISETKEKIGMFVKVSSLDELKAAYSYRKYEYYLEDEEIPMASEFIRDPAVPLGIPDSSPEMEMPLESPPPTAAADKPLAPDMSPPTDLMPRTDDQLLSSSDPDVDLEDHSSTNTQVEGIDEGDIVKTDGTYIYIIRDTQLKIAKVSDGGGLSLIANVSLGNSINAEELYIDKNRVIVVGSRYEYGQIEPFLDKNIGNLVCVEVYDVSDMANPKLIRSFDIQGASIATRKKGDYIYLVTNYEDWSWNIDPRPILIEDSNAICLPLPDIMVARQTQSDSILTVNAINFRDADEPVSRESITGSGYGVYMSHNALYIAMPNYLGYNSNNLNVARFSINGDKIGYSGSAAVEGSINDQFSMDEYDGNFRIATSSWQSANNNLYVLDGNMDICGSVLGYAPGERIYSTRFMGSRGYVVTFRETDPLFVFDLSDPTAPKITGELKVPGFSEYLHPVSESVLLGFGRDVVDIIRRDTSGKEFVTGQSTGGLKVSLFDVSNAGLPKELDTLIFGDYGYSELLYNHKAAMFKPDESFVAFAAELYMGNDWEADFVGALLISYKDNKLSERGRISNTENGCYGNRLVYIGNTLYYMQGDKLCSYDLTTLKQLQALSLQ